MKEQVFNLEMRKRTSLPYHPRAATDRKPSDKAGHKRMVARAGSFKDAPITKFIYFEDSKSEGQGSSSSREDLVQP